MHYEGHVVEDEAGEHEGYLPEAGLEPFFDGVDANLYRYVVVDHPVIVVYVVKNNPAGEANRNQVAHRQRHQHGALLSHEFQVSKRIVQKFELIGVHNVRPK